VCTGSERVQVASLHVYAGTVWDSQIKLRRGEVGRPCRRSASAGDECMEGSKRMDLTRRKVLGEPGGDLNRAAAFEQGRIEQHVAG
jgi:hypothetical protein